jgi:hypothetical protein
MLTLEPNRRITKKCTGATGRVFLEAESLGRRPVISTVIRLKMPQTEDANKIAPSRRLRRRGICFLGIALFFASCSFAAYKHLNLQAPSVSLTTDPNVSWNHLQTERWGYTLKHDARVAYFGFHPHGSVSATTGTRDGETEAVTGVVYQWRIETPTRLVLTDEGGFTVYYVFDLTDLHARTATVTDVSAAETLSFIRKYYSESGG